MVQAAQSQSFLLGGSMTTSAAAATPKVVQPTVASSKAAAAATPPAATPATILLATAPAIARVVLVDMHHPGSHNGVGDQGWRACPIWARLPTGQGMCWQVPTRMGLGDWRGQGV